MTAPPAGIDWPAAENLLRRLARTTAAALPPGDAAVVLLAVAVALLATRGAGPVMTTRDATP